MTSRDLHFLYTSMAQFLEGVLKLFLDGLRFSSAVDCENIIGIAVLQLAIFDREFASFG